LRRGDPVPDTGYKGEYVAELAEEYEGHDVAMTAGSWAAERILEDIRHVCRKIGVDFDVWSSQASFEDGEAVHAAIESLRQQGRVYDKDGAVWLGTPDDEEVRDRVLVRGDGTYTYLAGDLAYHYDKLVVR